MNSILHAEQDIKNYLFYNHDVCVNFVTRHTKYAPRELPTGYALQCTTKDNLFQQMVELVKELEIEHMISTDNAFLKCIILKNPEDVLKIAGHIQEVKL